MSTTVRVNRHGRLGLRIRHAGNEDYVGSKLLDDRPDGPNVTKLRAVAILVDCDLRSGRERPVTVKTVRNIVDWHFRALYRDARQELLAQGINLGDPFATLRWPRIPHGRPDPFTPTERDLILAEYRARRAFWYPFIHFQFFTGCRPSETAALRRSDVDLDRGIVSITKSRDEPHEGAPKTAKSEREIQFLPNVVDVLGVVLGGRNAARDAYVFQNRDGRPIATRDWPRKSWFPVLERLGIRRRKFYATRHTFISWALNEGMNVQALAEYVGTSLAMIEKSYGRYTGGRSLAPLARSLRRTSPASDVGDRAGPASGNPAGTQAVRGGLWRRKPRRIRQLQNGPRGNRTAMG